MKVIWSPNATDSYTKIINIILDNWSATIAVELEKDVDTLIRNLEVYKYFCPASKKKIKLRRCVLSKQTSVLYEVNKAQIELIAFFDNRTNHSY